MNILVILGHPRAGSFNHAIAETTVRTLKDLGHEIIFHDLYKEGFDPVITYEEIPKGAALAPLVGKHCGEAADADGIIIVHPNWWGQPPAVLKGWVDRVLRPGVAYDFGEGDGGEGVPVGLLKAGAALVFNTSNTPEEREIRVFGDPLETIWKNCIFDFCGIKKFYRKMFRVVVTSSEEQRKQWLREVEGITKRYFPAAVSAVSDPDDSIDG
ncbi:MAG: NAD(P)H-dependent oxidoreductase [Nitrospirota bacterium]